MTATQSARRAGFLAQLNASGESVILPSGQVVTALIDRAVIQQARRAGSPDFHTKASASIEFLTPVVAPVVGQTILSVKDPTKRFRVMESFDETGYSMRFVCQPSSTIS